VCDVGVGEDVVEQEVERCDRDGEQNMERRGTRNNCLYKSSDRR
jgi:hypothetical protein